MQGRLVFGRWLKAGSISNGAGSASAAGWAMKQGLLRLTTTKSPNRAAVHGHRLPIPRVIDEEEVKEVIEKGKEEKEKKRKEVEKTVDSQINRSDIEAFPTPSAS